MWMQLIEVAKEKALMGNQSPSSPELSVTQVVIYSPPVVGASSEGRRMTFSLIHCNAVLCRVKNLSPVLSSQRGVCGL